MNDFVAPTSFIVWMEKRREKTFKRTVLFINTKEMKSNKTMNVSSTKDTAKIKKLSSNKKYYVRVRSYAKYNTEKANNIYKYSSWSNVKSAKIK